MEIRKFFIGRALVLYIVLGMSALFALFYLLNGYIYREKQAVPGEEVVPYRATLSGEYLCLPYATSTDPATEECVGGLKTEVGEYYVIDFNLMSQVASTDLSLGDRITVTGVIAPLESLDVDSWQFHSVAGVFSVTDSLQIQ
jgi:hypothetical protein